MQVNWFVPRSLANISWRGCWYSAGRLWIKSLKSLRPRCIVGAGGWPVSERDELDNSVTHLSQHSDSYVMTFTERRLVVLKQFSLWGKAVFSRTKWSVSLSLNNCDIYNNASIHTLLLAPCQAFKMLYIFMQAHDTNNQDFLLSGMNYCVDYYSERLRWKAY